jgi:hypothetical protein
MPWVFLGFECHESLQTQVEYGQKWFLGIDGLVTGAVEMKTGTSGL